MKENEENGGGTAGLKIRHEPRATRGEMNTITKAVRANYVNASIPKDFYVKFK